MKIGRNDPCPCGSDRKYKKCHLSTEDESIAVMINKMRQPEPFGDRGHLIGRPMISTNFKGFRVVAVGNRVYPKLPINTTFHEFLIIFLKDILSLDWGKAEILKPKNEQHIIVQWITEMGELFRTAPAIVEDKARDIKSVEPSGNVQSLLSLAYDIYSIYHCTELPNELVQRLKNSGEFQGAKYEIAVAGIFARAGFTIQWFSKGIVKRCEFIATHKYTGEKIIVEAKSRHRLGVLHTLGKREDLSKMTAQVGHLFNQALTKPTQGHPFVIFIDINLPLTEGDNTLNKRWVPDIKKMLDKHPIGTAQKPDPFTALFITNFSWHYIGQNIEMKKGETVTIIPLFMSVRVRDQGTLNLLHTASEQYGVVPPLFPENN